MNQIFADNLNFLAVFTVRVRNQLDLEFKKTAENSSKTFFYLVGYNFVLIVSNLSLPPGVFELNHNCKNCHQKNNINTQYAQL